MSQWRQNRASGFTLLEVLVVLVLIGLLLGVATPQVMRMFAGAKADVARVQLESVATAIEYYQLDTGEYPPTEAGLEALITRPEGLPEWNGPYVKKRKHLLDPWGQPFQYAYPGTHTEPYDLTTLGADRAEGGEGDNADVANWQLD